MAKLIDPGGTDYCGRGVPLPDEKKAKAEAAGKAAHDRAGGAYTKAYKRPLDATLTKTRNGAWKTNGPRENE